MTRRGQVTSVGNGEWITEEVTATDADIAAINSELGLVAGDNDRVWFQ